LLLSLLLLLPLPVAVVVDAKVVLFTGAESTFAAEAGEFGVEDAERNGSWVEVAVRVD